MEIPKYPNRDWINRVRECNESGLCRGGALGGSVFPRGTILKLKDPGSGAWPLNTVKEYTVVHDDYLEISAGDGEGENCRTHACHKWFLEVRVEGEDTAAEFNAYEGNFYFEVYYPVTEETGLLPTVKFSLLEEGLEDVEQEIVLGINTKWKLQLAKMRLSFAMSLNENLSVNSYIKDVPEDIITSIGENIEKVVGERPLNDHKGGYGGGKKKKRKSKRKKKKTKRRKSKRKKHKTKRRKS